MTLLCLAQAANFVPFRDPLWGGWNYWPAFLIPLCVGIAIVYKGMRVEEIRDLPGVATRWALLLIGSIVGLALALLIVMRLIQV